jgi:hypothetical protein
MPVVLVPDPNLDISDISGATAVLGSLEAFVQEDWGLPPYPAGAGGGGADAK